MKNDAPDINTILKSGKKKGKKKYIFAAVIVIALLFFFLRPKGSGPAPQFSTASVKKGDLIVTVSATGTIEPTNEVQVGSELSGTIREVFVDNNSQVQKNQLLAKIDTAKLDASVTQAKAALAAAKANVLQMKAAEKETQLKLNQLQKLWKLTDKKSPSQSDLDTAEANYAKATANTASAKASVTQAEATLDSQLTNLSKAEIRSPVNGIVLNRNIEPGQTVAATYQAPVLFTLAEDLKKMELDVNVDEADIGKVQVGQKAAFTVDAYPDKTFHGTVTKVLYGPETVDNVVTYETVIEVDNTDMFLRPGMTATADITVKELNNVILIPNAAFRYAPPKRTQEKQSLLGRIMPHRPRGEESSAPKPTKQGEATVWALENGAEVPYSVKLGDSDGSSRQMIQGKLKDGMKLITGRKFSSGK